MRPHEKINFYSIIATAFIVFGLWSAISKLPDKYILVTLAVGAITSGAIYRLILVQAIKLAEKTTWIKKFVFNSYYIEGTWIGFNIGPSGKERIMFERIEQYFDKIVIRGSSYDLDKKLTSSWVAENANLNISKSELSYMYSCKPINGQSNHEGIGMFDLSRNSQYECPYEMTGYSIDTHSGNRVKAIESKISHKNNMKNEMVITRALEFYNKRKDSF